MHGVQAVQLWDPHPCTSCMIAYCMGSMQSHLTCHCSVQQACVCKVRSTPCLQALEGCDEHSSHLASMLIWRLHTLALETCSAYTHLHICFMCAHCLTICAESATVVIRKDLRDIAAVAIRAIISALDIIVCLLFVLLPQRWYTLSVVVSRLSKPSLAAVCQNCGPCRHCIQSIAWTRCQTVRCDCPQMLSGCSLPASGGM